MNGRTNTAILIILAVVLCGCGLTTSQSSVEGNQRWNVARSEMVLTRAAEEFSKGDLNGAYLSTRQALGINPESFPGRLMLTKILVARCKYADALAELDRLTDEQPELAELYYLRGAVQDGMNDFEQALVNHRKACELNPTDAGYLVAQVDCLTALGRCQEALDLVEGSLLSLAGTASAYELAGDLAVSLQQHEKAITYYRRAVSFDPKNLDIQHSLAGAYYHQGRYAEAAEILHRLVSEKPYSKSAWTNSMLGDCLMALNSPEKACDSYSRAADLDNANVAVLVNLAKSSLACNDYPRAVLSARRALRRDGDNLSASMVLAYSLMRQGHNDQAIDELIRCEGAHPDDATLMCLIGKAYEADGQTQLARRYYARALEVDAGNRLARGLLAGVNK